MPKYYRKNKMKIFVIYVIILKIFRGIRDV